MTHDVLQSDIELARRLLDEHRPASEIVEALTHRGVESNRATQLVADLAAGKKVAPDKAIKINLPSNPIQRESAAAESRSGRRIPPHARRAERSRSKGKADGIPWFTILALSSAAVCLAAFVLINRKSHGLKPVEQNEFADKSGTTSVGGRLRVEPKAIFLEVEKSGLSFCGHAITRENFLAVIFEVLGAPTRTNQVENAEQTIYAYDPCGLLVCSSKSSGRRSSIVLDFDATDGNAGTRNAFIGILNVAAYPVQSSTDAASLGLIKGLELQTPKSASGIFRGEFGNLELVFGYLKTPERLSLVEIDF